MALQSQLFRGDVKLEAAAVSDPAHIFQGARGPHVAKIQQALIQSDGAGIAPDGIFGPKTGAAVRAFKQRRQILNAQGQIDEIVGKKTTVALDSEMLARERGGGGGGGGGGLLGIRPSRGGPDIVPRPPGTKVIVAPPFIVPFSGPPVLLIKTFDDPVPNDTKNDLNASDPPRPPLKTREAVSVGFFVALPTPVLEGLMDVELRTLAGSLGGSMFNLFKSNDLAGRPIPFPPGSELSRRVEASTAFKTAHANVSLEFEAALRAQFAKGRVDVTALEAKTPSKGRFGRPQLINPDGIKTSLDLALDGEEIALKAVIGGSFQGGQVAVTAFSANADNATYAATLQYTMIDHFGVDNSDVLLPLPHGSPGQVAFWILQHQRHPGHFPYVTTVIVERVVRGKLAG